MTDDLSMYITCPGCGEEVHPDDIRRLAVFGNMGYPCRSILHIIPIPRVDGGPAEKGFFESKQCLRNQIAKLKKDAAEEESWYECAKCGATYEDDGKEHPAGVFCQECKKTGADAIGVCHRQTRRKRITQQDWDELKAENRKLKDVIGGDDRKAPSDMLMKVAADMGIPVERVNLRTGERDSNEVDS